MSEEELDTESEECIELEESYNDWSDWIEEEETDDVNIPFDQYAEKYGITGGSAVGVALSPLDDDKPNFNRTLYYEQ